MRTSPTRRLLPLASCLLACACASTGGYRIVDTGTVQPLSLEELADALADKDVVFLGEEHDNDTAHELQLALTEALLARRGEVAVSLEMFERDVQPELTLYIQGATSEERFLAHSRPWPNYAEHYRGVIELARAENLDVLAANCPRPLASRVSKEGLVALRGDPWAATNVLAHDGPYYDRFAQAMGGHGGSIDMRRFFQAQVVKDETMAESIALYLADQGEDAPQVVHWCGKFHSDYGLGTVEALARRRPDLDIAIVSTLSGKRSIALSVDDRDRADFVWLVPRP